MPLPLRRTLVLFVKFSASFVPFLSENELILEQKAARIRELAATLSRIMQSINPKDILTTLHLIRAGLVSGLLSKGEVIDWADRIITEDEHPDIFFIDLALSSSKSNNDIIQYFSEYLNFENSAVVGRPLLGLLYKQYQSGQRNLEQTVRALYRLKSEAVFNQSEEGYIYSIDDSYDLAHDNIYGTVSDVQTEVENFLELYKEYSFDNSEQWHDLDTRVDRELEDEIQRQQEQYQARQIEDKKKWWKFW